MQIVQQPSEDTWYQLVKRPAASYADIEKTVRKILNQVKLKGDKAIRKYTHEFDHVRLRKLEVTAKEIRNAGKLISNDLKKAIVQAAENITNFHSQQKQDGEEVETMNGIVCWRRAVGIEKVGLYIPGGSAPLFSTVLMLGIPAVIAGCKEIQLCTPPQKDGSIHPAILFAAQIVGINRVYKVGGVQAIAALAYGTDSIPQVYKIFGPGNQYVTMAKQLVQQEGVAIDMPAGPSELCILADASAEPSFVAADLLSQAEHGSDSQVLLVTSSESLVRRVNKEIETQLEMLPRKKLALNSLSNSRAIVFDGLDRAMEFVNAYAPEHLILCCKDVGKIAEKVINAGSVFLGNFTPESVGDYASGTNHTLPTNGFARAYSGVSVDSFVKKITFQQLSQQGLENISSTVITMAENEGLRAHANAVRVRLKSF